MTLSQPITSFDPEAGYCDIQWLLRGQRDPNDVVQEYEIAKAPYMIGRGPQCHLQLSVRSVSNNHASVCLTKLGPAVEDLNSTNGTFVNGSRINCKTLLKEGDLVQFAETVFRVLKKRKRTDVQTVQRESEDDALALIQFERLLSSNGLLAHFQPIVNLRDRTHFGYEVLGRSRLVGLQSPRQMFMAAAQLNMETELSESFRKLGVQCGAEFGSDTHIFLNTHPNEVGQEQLIDSLDQLRRMTNQKIVLEIHEMAVADGNCMRDLCAALEDFDIKLAFDDFGSGESRLVELGEFRPEFIKFDIGLIRDIENAPTQRRKVVELLVKLVHDLNIISLAEGVETSESHQVLQEIGFELGQGYFYGRPESVSKYAAVDSFRIKSGR